MKPWKITITCSMSLASLALIAGSAFARDIYWSEEKKIFASDIDGGNVTEIFDGATSTPVMESYIVDIDATADYIYWTGHSGGDVWRANRDGSNPVQLVSVENASIHFLEIDETEGRLRFSDFGGRILETDLDGENLQIVFNQSGFSGLGGFFTDPNPIQYDDEVWAVRSIEPSLFRLVVDEWGGWVNAPHPALQGGNGNYGLVHVPDTNTVYYTNYNESTLRSYNLTTEEHELLETPDMANPLDIELSPSGTHLLIAERGRGVSGYELATGGYELLTEAPGAHFGVAVTADPGTLEVPQPPEPGTLLLAVDFEEDELGANPAVNWSEINPPADGTAVVVQDTERVFGGDEENRFLRVETARDLEFIAHYEPVAVVTLSYDYIGRVNEGDTSRALNLNLRAGDLNSTRVHVVQINPISGLIDTVPFGSNDTPYRFDLIMNNSAETLEYERPDGGGTASVDSERVALWRYDYSTETWDLLREGEARHRGGSARLGDKIMNFSIQLDSNAGFFRSFDMDNIRIYAGAVPGLDVREADVDPIPPPPFLGHLELDFEEIPLGEITRENRTDFEHGNLTRIAFLSQYDTPLLIVEDTENRFGEGPENQILRTNRARGWTFVADNNFDEEVMTLRMDMIAEQTSNARLTSRFYDVDRKIVSRIEFRATASSHGTFTGGAAQNPGNWEYGIVNRFESVVNNSDTAIDYATPAGETKTLISGGTDLWVNGELVFSDSLDGRDATPGAIMSYDLRTFSGNPWAGDISLIRTYAGAVLVGAGAPPLHEGYADWLDLHFPGITDPAIIGPDADPDGDGVSNLIEYALGMNPNEASREGLPVLGEVEIDGLHYLTLTGTLPDGTNLDLTVEATSDLSDWSDPDLGVPVSGTPNGDGTTTYTFRDVEPIDSNGRRFMRLNVDFRTD